MNAMMSRISPWRESFPTDPSLLGFMNVRLRTMTNGRAAAKKVLPHGDTNSSFREPFCASEDVRVQNDYPIPKIFSQIREVCPPPPLPKCRPILEGECPVLRLTLACNLPCTQGANGPVCVGYFGYLTQISSKWIQACINLGIPLSPDINTPSGTLGVTKASLSHCTDVLHVMLIWL